MFKRFLALFSSPTKADLTVAESIRADYRGHRCALEELVNEIHSHRMAIANEVLDLEQEDDSLQAVLDELEAFLGA